MKRKQYDRYHKMINIFLKANIPFLGNYLQSKVYDRHFYEDANDLKSKSSRQVAEIIVSMFDFKNVFDIGCGCGLYIEELYRLGKDVMGCDGSAQAIALASKDFTVFRCDVTKPICLNRRFDLILCIEVAEHIKRKFSAQLVKNCVNYGERVIFTAALPGQGGVGHINEQPREFWIKLFEKNDFYYEEESSECVRKIMKEHSVVEWIVKNLMLFRKKS